VPPGANAADLYRQALNSNHNDPRATAGIEKVIDKLLSGAEAQLASRHLKEAQRLTDEARALKPDHLRVAFLTAQIAKERERFLSAQMRQAAADSRTGQANVLPSEIVDAASLELADYQAPAFPPAARERGLNGWVDVQFLVDVDGRVSDAIITGAEPAGIFEQAAVDALKQWRYKPLQRDGHAVDQRARLRMKFALDK
jgi:TonB family protein